MYFKTGWPFACAPYMWENLILVLWEFGGTPKIKLPTHENLLQQKHCTSMPMQKYLHSIVSFHTDCWVDDGSASTWTRVSNLEDGGSIFPRNILIRSYQTVHKSKRGLSSALSHLCVHCTLSPVLKSRIGVLPRWVKKYYMGFSSTLAKAATWIFPQQTWSRTITVWQWDGFSELVQKLKEMQACQQPLPPPHTHTCAQPQQHGGMICTMFLCTEGKQAKNWDLHSSRILRNE